MLTHTADAHQAYQAFTQPRAPRSERRSAGERTRALLPLSEHAAAPEAAAARAPLAVLQAQEDVREPGLVPLRYERMAASPFAFLRGAAAVMAADLAALPHSGIRVQLCGDAHVANFGMFAAPDRRLVFDLNDFDETLPGPFEWDVKRLAASVVVAGRHLGLTPKQTRKAAAAAATEYRTTTARLAALDPLETWFARVDVDDLLTRLRGSGLDRGARRAGRTAVKNTGAVAVRKFTEVVDGARRFRDAPPLLVRIDEGTLPGVTASASELYRQYLATLPADRILLLLRYAFADLAHKVVGVGSVGTRALALLLVSGDGDPLVLQVKQAGAAVLEPHLGASEFDHAGQRVVVGQRLMQAAGDPFLGWTRGGEHAPFDFYVRQLRDMKGSIDLDRLQADGLSTYARVCGAVLARAHARAGDPAVSAGYLGSTSDFDHAIAVFAETYADVTERDHAALVAAIARGDVPSQAQG